MAKPGGGRAARPDVAVGVGVDALQQRLRRGLDRLHLELAQQRVRRGELKEVIEQLLPRDEAVRVAVERDEELRGRGDVARSLSTQRFLLRTPWIFTSRGRPWPRSSKTFT